jgi:hypothetical protein
MSDKRKHFPLITVPMELHSQIVYLEKVCVQLGAETDPEKIEQLFSQLSYARKFLYEYLEARCGVQEDDKLTHLRFT